MVEQQGKILKTDWGTVVVNGTQGLMCFQLKSSVRTISLTADGITALIEFLQGAQESLLEETRKWGPKPKGSILYFVNAKDIPPEAEVFEL